MASSSAEVSRSWRAHKRVTNDGPTLTIGFAGSFTCEPIEAAFGHRLLEGGIERPGVRFADYNQLHQLCLDPETTLGGSIDHIIALWRIEDLWADQIERYISGDEQAGNEAVRGVAELGSMLGQLALGAAALTVSVPPAIRPWGVDARDARITVPLGALHRSCVTAYLDALSDSRATLIDLDAITAASGTDTVTDDTKWAMYRQPYTSAFWLELGRNAAEVVLRERIAAPKCLVLDCDNTLWGGVIGEDGLGGIQLGDTFPGSGFRTFQKIIKQVKDAGVFLALASKNDESAVLEVFEQHDGMALTADDIAVWKVNWMPKSGNLAEIAQELNIGIDSLVFVDDSSYEIAEVNGAQPLVTTVQVPEDPAELPALLAATGLFRHLRVSDEDRARTEMVLAEKEREAAGSAMDRETFLASLELQVDVFTPGEEHIGRLAQLTNKTNQFNLTTQRRSEAEISALVESETHEVRAMRVRDRFGDYGIVGLAVMETGDTEWEVDSFLMSCRVLGRGVETALLSTIVDDAAAAGARRVRGRYLPTPKNGQVADFYERHGFEAAEADGETTATIASAEPAPPHITINR